MIYIYGSGGRGRLIKELLIRLGNTKKEIVFVDDKKKKYKKSNYLIKRFNKKKTVYSLVLQNQSYKLRNTYILKRNLKT